MKVDWGMSPWPNWRIRFALFAFSG
jgi:hypothetical protein